MSRTQGWSRNLALIPSCIRWFPGPRPLHRRRLSPRLRHRHRSRRRRPSHRHPCLPRPVLPCLIPRCRRPGRPGRRRRCPRTLFLRRMESWERRPRPCRSGRPNFRCPRHPGASRCRHLRKSPTRRRPLRRPFRYCRPYRVAAAAILRSLRFPAMLPRPTPQRRPTTNDVLGRPPEIETWLAPFRYYHTQLMDMPPDCAVVHGASAIGPLRSGAAMMTMIPPTRTPAPTPAIVQPRWLRRLPESNSGRAAV